MSSSFFEKIVRPKYSNFQTDTNDGVASSEGQNEPKLVIWGTDVVVAETKERFTRFLKTFINESEEDDNSGEFDPSRPLYLQKLEEVNCNV